MLQKFWLYACVCLGPFFPLLAATHSKKEHTSFKIEKSSQKLRFFNLDLHISVIADVKDILEAYGHEVTNWSISGHTHIFNKPKDKVKIVNENTWWNLDQKMCHKFYDKYKDYLNQFDAFIVTHAASFALLYEKFNKPIIIVNSTRYENPFTKDPKKWNWLNEYLKKGVEKGKIFIVSNNKGDQGYLKYYTGLDSVHIPSLCLYTKGQHTGRKPGFILRSLGGSDVLKTVKMALAHPGLIQNESLPSDYKWQTLYDFQGIVHFPYNISTMSLFEQYSANVPLFFPHKKYLSTFAKLNKEGILSQLSFFQVSHTPLPTLKGDLNNLNDEEVLNFWINAADFYDQENMPYIQYFESMEHLDTLLRTTDLKTVSKQMKAHNIKRKQKAFKEWGSLLEKVIHSTKS